MLLRLEGFDGGGTTLGSAGFGQMVAYLESRYPAADLGLTGNRVMTQNGWGSGYALSWGEASGAGSRYISIPVGTQTEIFVGLAIQPSVTPTSPQNGLISWMDEVSAVEHLEMQIVNGTHIAFYRGGGTLLASAPGMKQGKWSYVEVRVVFSNTVGIIECRINGSQVINATGLDTIEGGASTSINAIRLTGARGADSTTATMQWLIDDVYILDTTGAVNNTFLGPIKIETLFPNAEGGTIDFTPSTGTDNSALVDENPRNDDTDYNESADTASNKDLFAAGNLSVIDSGIVGVQITSDARLDAGSPIGLQSIVFENATQGTGSVIEVSSTTDYEAVQHIFELNPDTTAAWSTTEVDAMEIGYEID